MKIKERMDQLYRIKKTDLKEIVKRNYRVVDVSEADKQSLISMILSAEFGKNYYEKMTAEVRP